MSATPLNGLLVSDPSTVKPENWIVWHVVPKTVHTGTSGTSIALAVDEVAGDVEMVSGVVVVVAYAVVNIFESTKERMSCATAEATGTTCPIILVVVPASDGALDDAFDAGGITMMVSVAGAVFVGAVQSLVDAFAIRNAAACRALTDGSTFGAPLDV